jgi:hypothetical protein
MSFSSGLKARSDLLALLQGQTASRLVAKLESEPRQAESWNWSQPEQDLVKVVTPNNAEVTVHLKEGVLGSLDDLSCNCLLAPKCIHRLAVLALLAPAESEESAADVTQSSAEAPLLEERASSLEKLAAAQACLNQAAANLLATGCENAGVVMQGQLLQAAYHCKLVGLHRAARAAYSVNDSIRKLQSDSADFSLDSLRLQLQELLLVCHSLGRGGLNDIVWIGRSRRDYQPVGNLKLFGVACEPVLTASGFAGVITILSDGRGLFYSINDVRPTVQNLTTTAGPTPSNLEKNEDRILGAYQNGMSFAGLSQPHRRLCRQTLLIEGATVSPEGRLGSGQGVRAVVLNGSSGLLAPSSAGLELTTITARILGLERGQLVLQDPQGRLWRGAPFPTQVGRDNHLLLARAAGREFQWLVRVPADGPLRLLALYWSELPDDWGGLCNLGLDGLHPSFFAEGPGLAKQPVRISIEPDPDPLWWLRQRLGQVVREGRRALPVRIDATMTKHCQNLRALQLEVAAGLLENLCQAAWGGQRDFQGRLQPTKVEEFTKAWLSACLFESRFAKELAQLPSDI